MNTVTPMLLLFCLSQAETLPPPLISPDALIRDLSSTYAKRTSASRALRAMGESARPALERAAIGDDLETRRRADGLLYSLNQDRRRRAMAFVDERFPSLPYVDLAWFKDGCFDHTSELYRKLWPYYELADDEPDRMNRGWGKYRRALRLALYDWAEAGMEPWAMSAFVEMMWANEAAYFAR